MTEQGLLKVTTYLARITIVAFWNYVKTSLYTWNNIGFKNLYHVTKRWLLKIVTTFLVLFSNGNHKLTAWM